MTTSNCRPAHPRRGSRPRIRLSGSAWNGDTDPTLLSKIQQAYIVLSDVELRDAYDEHLQRIADQADLELQVVLDQNTTRLPRRVQDVPAPLIAVLSAWAA